MAEIGKVYMSIGNLHKSLIENNKAKENYEKSICHFEEYTS